MNTPSKIKTGLNDTGIRTEKGKFFKILKLLIFIIQVMAVCWYIISCSEAYGIRAVIDLMHNFNWSYLWWHDNIAI